MTARDELPEGFKIFIGIMGDSYLSMPSGHKLIFYTRAAAIAAAWRIVDAEKEAKDGW